MANTNTTIQILRSYSTPEPIVLADGELAYSFTSNTMFIGNIYGDIIKIGGPNYIQSVAANATISLIDGGGF